MHSAPEVSGWKAAIVHDFVIVPYAHLEYSMSADHPVATVISDVGALTLRANYGSRSIIRSDSAVYFCNKYVATARHHPIEVATRNVGDTAHSSRREARQANNHWK